MRFRNALNSRHVFCHIFDFVVSENCNIFVGQSHCTQGRDTFFEMLKKLFNCFLMSNQFMSGLVVKNDDYQN